MGTGTRRRSSALALVAAVVSVVVAAAGGCSTGGGTATAPTGPPTYVALGDSYTSGAGLSEVVVSAGQCAQSKLAYPTLVAKTLGGEVVDMACGGATTDNGAAPQVRPDGSRWPAQLSVLTAKTRLVTVGIGFNDFNLFGDIVAGCASLAAQDPDGSPCADDPRAADVATLPAQIGTRVAAYLAAVEQKAPHAQVVLVGYPQLVPASGTCDALPLAAGDYPFVRGVLTALEDAEREAAQTAGVRYVDVATPSEGHDICAGDQAWVNGGTAQPDVAAAYHPFAAGQDAIARLVLGSLA